MIAGRSVRWIEGKKEFISVRETAEFFNDSYSRIWRNLKEKNGKFILREGVTLKWEIYLPKKGEEFRPVPGYEGLYSISNLRNVRSEVGQRLLKPATPKSGRNRGIKEVVLYKDSIPSPYPVSSLFRKAFPELVTNPTSTPGFKGGCQQSRSKPVICTSDPLEYGFESYMDCCKYYKLDYQQFRKAVRKARENGSATFTFKGKDFMISRREVIA